MIQLININKYYKSGSEQFHALKDVNLQFGDKGMHFILGKSGSGKSTLLNIIGGIDFYDSGELIIDGVATSKFNKQQYNTYRNTYIGFIFQEFNVLKSLSVYDNIAISLELQHKNVKAEHAIVQDIIDKVGLTGLENRMMNQLSGGQRQRVAIARSLIKNPRVIIADEPTGNLDSKNSKMIMDLLKELAKDRLVIVVSHSDQLAHEYSDRTIEIKDGVITRDDEQEQINDVDLDLKPISVPYKTSLKLAFKAIRRNVKRFVFMILLFAIALVFAGVVINMYLADTTLTYAEYQQEFKNNIVGLKSEFQTRGYTQNTAFFEFQIDNFLSKYETEDANYSIIKGMDYNIPIDQNAVVEDEFYMNTIQRFNVIPNDSREYMRFVYNTTVQVTDPSLIQVYITDYIAENLIFQNYFGSSVTNIKQIHGKVIDLESFSRDIIVCGIIDTNYEDYKQYFTYFNEDAGNDTKAKNAFFDNLLYFNSIFLKSENDFEKLVNDDNIEYFYTDAIYQMVGDTGKSSGLKITPYDHSQNYILPLSKDAKAPTAHLEDEPTQVAVSTGFFEKILNINIDEIETTETENLCDLLFKKVYFQIPVYYEGSDVPKMQNVYSANFLCLTSYVPINYTFEITTVIEDENPILYTAPTEESGDYQLLLNNLFKNGGYISLYMKETTDLSNDELLRKNADLYRDFINNEMIITNNSFGKILLVDSFINDNLPLFIGVFFVFALFSILLIFNFVIINIKNSTRDIGIYMSLGFSGWKIALIYLFQVIVLGLVAFIISIAGVSVFLVVLDNHFTALSAVNLAIIKVSFLGIIIMLMIALLIPILSVIIPLFNLSRKNPVDVIKTI